MALQFLHQLGQDHGVLAAGDAHGDSVPRLDQLVPLHSGDKGVPDGFAIGLMRLRSQSPAVSVPGTYVLILSYCYSQMAPNFKMDAVIRRSHGRFSQSSSV